jgi:probable biosynthetic protein (TIGR04098 family)
MAETAMVTGIQRRVLVTPSMCGHNALLFTRIGDWTWETVARQCGTDVFRATTADGRPAYLSFFYFRVRGSALLHPHSFTFGDEIAVTSACLGLGSESVLTLHRICHASSLSQPSGVLDLREFFDAPHPGCLYVETMNRWVARSVPSSNRGLTPASPPGFRHDHLTPVPQRYSPRADCAHARSAASFHGKEIDGYELIDSLESLARPVDAARDLNGVGLVHFSSFFSYVDGGVLRAWQSLGRDSRRFLARRVLDHRVCITGNADANAVLDISTRVWRCRRDHAREIAEVVIRDREDARLLAVAAVQTLEGM